MGFRNLGLSANLITDGLSGETDAAEAPLRVTAPSVSGDDRSASVPDAELGSGGLQDADKSGVAVDASDGWSPTDEGT